MTKVKLTAEMIGTRTPDLVTYPQVDVQGREYDRKTVNTRNVAKQGLFVVIPAAIDGVDLWEFELPAEPKRAQDASRASS